MIMRKIPAASLIILGAALFIFGTYTSKKAAQGELTISEAEANEQGRRRPLVGPIRKSMNAQATQSAQRKISSAQQNVTASQVSANWLQGSGIVVFLVGLGCLIFSAKKRD